MNEQGSSNSKLPAYSKEMNLTKEVFPGLGKEDTENFINQFAYLNQLIKHIDLLTHLSDPNNIKIKRRDDESVSVNQPRDQLVKTFFNHHMKRQREIHRMSWNTNFDTKVITIYLGQGNTCRIPQMVILGLSPSGRQQAKLHNSLNLENPELMIHKTDEVAVDYIDNDFVFDHPIYGPPSDGSEYTSAQLERKLDEVGQIAELETYINTITTRDASSTTRYDAQTKNLTALFTTVIANIPSNIMLLVTNYEFTNAWNALLKHWIVDNDETNVITKLEMNFLTCTFNTTKHKDFIEYYNSLHQQYALYLYKVWYAFFTFEEIKEMVDTLSDTAIMLKHKTVMQTNNLVSGASSKYTTVSKGHTSTLLYYSSNRRTTKPTRRPWTNSRRHSQALIMMLATIASLPPSNTSPRVKPLDALPTT
jgi:hypothetical protein